MRLTNITRAALTAIFLSSLTMATAIAAVHPGPDTFGHTSADQVCTDVATPNCFGNLEGDDTCVARAVGFSFQHYGTTFSTVGVASNGFLQMGGCGAGSSDFTNDCPIPNAAATNNAIYGVWDDLNNGGTLGGICDGLSGVAPNRVYAVEYTNVPYFSGGGTVTFQVQIDENGGPPNEAKVRIDLRSIGQPNSYTSGLENATGTDALSRWCNAGTAGGICTQFSKAAAPPVGTCDLTPIEAKLDIIGPKITDIQTRVVSIDTDIDVRLSTRATQASVDALEAKTDLLKLDLQVAEAKLDAMPCNIINLLVGVLIRSLPSTHPCFIPAP